MCVCGTHSLMLKIARQVTCFCEHSVAPSHCQHPSTSTLSLRGSRTSMVRAVLVKAQLRAMKASPELVQAAESHFLYLRHQHRRHPWLHINHKQCQKWPHFHHHRRGYILWSGCMKPRGPFKYAGRWMRVSSEATISKQYHHHSNYLLGHRVEA